jgi:16S rRNA processing protein RimM
MTKKDKLILLGVISSAHGIKGEVIIKSFTEVESDIARLSLMDENNDPITIKVIRKHPKSGLVCKISGCNDRNQAEAILKKKIYCLREDLPEIDNEDEFYFEDLHGLEVIDAEDKIIGKVTNVANYGAGDIIEITFTEGDKSEFFPFTKELFPEVTKKYVRFCH